MLYTLFVQLPLQTYCLKIKDVGWQESHSRAFYTPIQSEDLWLNRLEEQQAYGTYVRLKL